MSPAESNHKTFKQCLTPMASIVKCKLSLFLQLTRIVQKLVGLLHRLWSSFNLLLKLKWPLKSCVSSSCPTQHNKWGSCLSMLLCSEGGYQSHQPTTLPRWTNSLQTKLHLLKACNTLNCLKVWTWTNQSSTSTTKANSNQQTMFLSNKNICLTRHQTSLMNLLVLPTTVKPK